MSNLVEKLESSIDRINKILRERNVYYEKAKQNLFQHLPVPVWHVVMSIEVATISVLMLKTHAHADFL